MTEAYENSYRCVIAYLPFDMTVPNCSILCQNPKFLDEPALEGIPALDMPLLPLPNWGVVERDTLTGVDITRTEAESVIPNLDALAEPSADSRAPDPVFKKRKIRFV